MNLYFYIQKLSGGLLNLMLSYHLTSDLELTDGVVVRIYHDDPDDKRFSRNNEFLGMQVSKLNCFECLNFA